MQEKLSLIPGLECFHGEENGNPLQYSCLGNPINRGAWWDTVHGVANSQSWLTTEHGTHTINDMPTKVHIVKDMVFPVVIYSCKRWTTKKAECWRIDAFKLWCWRRLFRIPWTASRSNQSILKEINSEYSLEGLMLKLKFHILATWCEKPTLWKRSWCWERLKAGGEGDYRGWDGWMASPTQWTWVWANSWR